MHNVGIKYTHGMHNNGHLGGGAQFLRMLISIVIDEPPCLETFLHLNRFQFNLNVLQFILIILHLIRIKIKKKKLI